MQIAPGVYDIDWQALKLDDPNSPDWARAVDIFRCRMYERFIEPIDFLIGSEKEKLPNERRFGFTILAVDCLLVETLGAFIDGLEDTIGKSMATYRKFLTSRFAEHFKDELADQFYEQFRCGILHQAEIGGDSRVWSVGPLLQVDGGNITVNRTAFHNRLKEELERYVAELQDPKNAELRANFRRKMDFISRKPT